MPAIAPQGMNMPRTVYKPARCSRNACKKALAMRNFHFAGRSTVHAQNAMVATSHPAAALAFIDFLMRPEIAARNANFVGNATVNAAALPLVLAPAPDPSGHLASLSADLPQAQGIGLDVTCGHRFEVDLRALGSRQLAMPRGGFL